MDSAWRLGLTAIDMGDIYTGVEALVGQHIARVLSCMAAAQAATAVSTSDSPPVALAATPAVVDSVGDGVIVHTKLVPDLNILAEVRPEVWVEEEALLVGCSLFWAFLRIAPFIYFCCSNPSPTLHAFPTHSCSQRSEEYSSADASHDAQLCFFLLFAEHRF